jgi:hypothetical protein
MGQPIMDHSANSASHQGRLAFAFMTGDQEQDTVAGSDGPLQCPVDRFPGAVEGVTVEVKQAIGLDPA